MTADVTGIVLAGGLSRRLGRNKAVEPVGGQPLIDRVLSRVGELTDEIVLVVAKLDQATVLPIPDSVRVVSDQYVGGGSLGGIYSGLDAAACNWGLVVACDMPFLNADLFEHMLSLRGDFDAVVPEIGGRPEPTHALYSRSCLEPIRLRLDDDQLKIASFFPDVRVRMVPQDVVDSFDPDHLSFFNVNTPEDLDRAARIAAGDAAT